jgi:isopentenyl-diphosphate delta-isomerase type 1
MLDNQKELFIVVDEDDNILEYRTRYDCHHDKSLIHRSIGVAVFNDKGEILLQKRSMLKDTQRGKYTLSVGGHVTKGQTYEEAAYREMQEEIGIQSELTFAVKFLSKRENETEMHMIYTTKYNGPFRIAKDEVEEVKFFTKEAIINLHEQLTPATKQALQKMGIL